MTTHGARRPDASDPEIRDARARVARGELRGEALLEWIAAHPPARRDAAVEALLGIGRAADAAAEMPLGAEGIGYVPSGVAAIVRAIVEAPIGAPDLVLDVGSGLGKVALLVHLACGARVRGLELQRELVVAARQRARALGIAVGAVTFEEGDASASALSDEAGVVYLYLPFTGATLAAFTERLREAALRRPRVVCALGVELAGAQWLVKRPSESFWLSVYDAGGRDASTGSADSSGRARFRALAERVASERA